MDTHPLNQASQVSDQDTATLMILGVLKILKILGLLLMLHIVLLIIASDIVDRILNHGTRR